MRALGAVQGENGRARGLHMRTRWLMGCDDHRGWERAVRAARIGYDGGSDGHNLRLDWDTGQGEGAALLRLSENVGKLVTVVASAQEGKDEAAAGDRLSTQFPLLFGRDGAPHLIVNSDDQICAFFGVGIRSIESQHSPILFQGCRILYFRG